MRYKARGSSPDPLDLVAQPLQLGDDALPLVALNLDAPVLDRPSGPAALLECCGQFSQAALVQRRVEYARHALASPARRLSADLHRLRLLCWLLRSGTIRGGNFSRTFLALAPAEDAGDEAHDFLFDQAQHFRRIINVPELDLLDPGRETLLQQRQMFSLVQSDDQRRPFEIVA